MPVQALANEPATLPFFYDRRMNGHLLRTYLMAVAHYTHWLGRWIRYVTHYAKTGSFLMGSSRFSFSKRKYSVCCAYFSALLMMAATGIARKIIHPGCHMLKKKPNTK